MSIGLSSLRRKTFKLIQIELALAPVDDILKGYNAELGATRPVDMAQRARVNA